jgi:hypothetical protein
VKRTTRNLVLALVCAASRPARAESPAAASAPQQFQIVSRFEIERGPGDFAGFGSAIEMTADGRSLIYVASGLHRLDLGTGGVETVVPDQEWRAAGLEVATPLELHMTGSLGRLVYVEESGSPCPWRVFLVVPAPFKASLLTERACGRIVLSPAGDKVAVSTRETCEGRPCGEERLLLFSVETGSSLFESKIAPDYVDAYWDGEERFILRYKDHFDPEERRYFYKAVPVLEAVGARWRLGESEPSPRPRVSEVEIGLDATIKLKAAGTAAGVVRVETNHLLGPVPGEYRAGTPHVFRVGNRVVVVRSLFEKQPATGIAPRRREQVVVIKLKAKS